MNRAPVISGETRLRTPADGVDFGLRELMAVREIVHAFLTADRPEEVFQFALDRVSPLVGATFACVYLLDGASELMRLGAAYNWPERYAPFLGEMRVRLGFGPSGEAASERRAIEVPDVFADPSLEDWQEVATELGFRSIAALPLQTGEGVLGTVTFYFGNVGGLSVETRSLLRMVADQMAATAQKARLIDDLRRANSALTDTNAELERQYAALVEARRLQDGFLANVTTELRAPLAEGIAYISTVLERGAGPASEQERAPLVAVKQAEERLLARINDLLELTELKRGGVEPSVTAFDPREPLREALAITAGRREGVALRTSEPESAPMMASDRRRIVRLLAGLIANAYAFTEHGEVRAGVEVHDDRVVYRVEDTGIGIPEDAQRYVFEEFRRAEGAARTARGGAGLGLALARRTARLLGGDIVLVSAPGEGSTFRVELPLVYEGPKQEGPGRDSSPSAGRTITE
ncbi:MAG TPA: GAF domain-containing sensor histidine kinase [Gemmatimonadaceae bacterium]|nr:GAF domain-containing sensor histidine kinase [Gemmatimonadaceae bacterium]